MSADGSQVVSTPAVDKLVGNIKSRSPQFFTLMDSLVQKFGKQHTQLINKTILREINKHPHNPKLSVRTIKRVLFPLAGPRSRSFSH